MITCTQFDPKDPSKCYACGSQSEAICVRNVKITNKENGYICGWIDADGCLSIYKQHRKGMKTGFDLTPAIKLANNDKNVILWLMKKMSIPQREKHPFPKKLRSGKISWMVQICSYEDVFRILTLLDLDSLITKREEAKTLLNFVKRRIERWDEFTRSNNRSDGKHRGGRYKKGEEFILLTDEDMQDYKVMKELKMLRGKSS